jgi:hypothetical protein
MIWLDPLFIHFFLHAVAFFTELQATTPDEASINSRRVTFFSPMELMVMLN